MFSQMHHSAAVGLALALLAGCASPPPVARTPDPAVTFTKPISFALLEDWDKGEDLALVEQDFRLVRELGFDTVRCSFGWDDYEPKAGEYDFEWLSNFASLAQKHGITLRPYIGYTPQWAGIKSKDDQDWNNPPSDLARFRGFVYRLVSEMRSHQNVVSYEIYNEENAPFWWDGSIDQYAQTLRAGSEAVRRANPHAQVLLGGFVYPDKNWMSHLVEAGDARYYDIAAFHAYPETWTEPGVTAENYLDDQYRTFVQLNRYPGENEPIWMDEMGFATKPGVTELQQAHWFARAISTYVADPYIQEIGVYELKDLRPDSRALGEAENYHLGLLNVDRTPKLAAETVTLLMDLLNTRTITVADQEADVHVVAGTPGELHYHLFRRPDMKQVLFIWDKSGSPTLDITLPQPANSPVRYDIVGRSGRYTRFDHATLRNVTLKPGEASIFLLQP